MAAGRGTKPPRMPFLLITGNSSGLGLELTREYLERGWQVAGLSRRGCPIVDAALRDLRCDLADLDRIPAGLDQLLRDQPRPDVLILNAAVLGDVADLGDTPLQAARHTMNVNLWANKQIIDWLRTGNRVPAQVVMISSGAAITPYRGLGAYALSKAALNMLAGLYARECPDSHFIALAPGIIDTAMQDALCEADIARFPAMESLRRARHTPDMPPPAQVARRIADLLPRLRRLPSGSFQDVLTL